jgi:hypothetical protein
MIIFDEFPDNPQQFPECPEFPEGPVVGGREMRDSFIDQENSVEKRMFSH